MMLKALVSLERVHKYLLCEEIHSEDITHYVQEGNDSIFNNFVSSLSKTVELYTDA